MFDGKDGFVTQRATIVAILIVTLLTLLASYVFYRQNLAIVAARDWVNHSYEVKGHIQELQSRLRDAVGAARTYMFTNDETFLAPYYEAIRPAADTEKKNETDTPRLSIAGEIAVLRKETADNAASQQTLDRIEPLSHELLAYLAGAIEKHKTHAVQPLAELDPRPTRQYLDKVRNLLEIMTADENRLLAQRNQKDFQNIHQSNFLIFSCIALFYILLVLSIWVYQRMRQISQIALLRYANQLKLNEEELQSQQEELRASNEEIEASNEELEEQNAQIRQQAAELRHSKDLLEQKARELELASQYKTEFLANMSHELRTPLNSLLILSRSLAANEDGNLTAEQIEEARIIHNDGIELLNLINDILDLSKVEAGKLNVIADDIEIEAILHQMRQQFTAIAKERQVAFPVLIEGDLPATIYTDAHRVEHILKNLLSNAFKFTEKGSVTLRAYRPTPGEAARAGLPGKEVIAFSVIDTGIGIDSSRFEDIFEAFQQEDGSTHRQYGGTGLGLAIVRKFSHLLGGEVLIESEKGNGSTFTLILPMRIAEPAVAALEADELKARPHLKSEAFSADRPMIADKDKILQDRTVLLADDDMRNTFALSKALKKYGLKVVIADDGQVALDRLKTDRSIELAIMDIMMPIMDGYKVMREIRAEPTLAHMPVIALTARAMPEEQAKCIEAGANDYLSKPVDINRLLTLMRAWLPQQEPAA